MKPTLDQVPVATEVTDVYRGGRIKDPPTGPVLVSAGVRLDWVQLPELEGSPGLPESGTRLLFADPLGFAAADPEGGVTRIAESIGSPGSIPRLAGAGQLLVDGLLLEHPPSGPVECQAPLWALQQLAVSSFGGVSGPHAMLESLATLDTARLLLSSREELPAEADLACKLELETPSIGIPFLAVDFEGTSEIPVFRWNGEIAYEGVAYGGVFKGGLLIEPLTTPPSGTLAGTYVVTAQNTDSSTPTDLPTAQHVTLDLDDVTTVWIEATADANLTTAGAVAVLWVDIDGADSPLTAATAPGASIAFSMAGRLMVTLTAGSHTLKLQFSVNVGVATFDRRSMTVRL